MSNRTENIPQHVAIIMDGNGRWAKARGLDRCFGHISGVESVRRAVKAASVRGVKYLTLYTFSTENWGRPDQEVQALMELLCKSVCNETPELVRQGVRVKVIGDLSRMSGIVREHLEQIQSRTAQGEGLTLVLAINYSSRDEITRAVKTLAARAAAGELDPQRIDAQRIAEALDTASIPDPDLLIRTSGECRLSNFLLWQAAYTEFYFTDVLWPDFDEQEFDRALESFAGRQRRYGLVTK
ncbi:MAG: isoprenyl transferase [Rikenellaceae bacterium]|nr:isoprenyl transferase [Rikenellaceae bacterium]